MKCRPVVCARCSRLSETRNQRLCFLARVYTIQHCRIISIEETKGGRETGFFFRHRYHCRAGESGHKSISTYRHGTAQSPRDNTESKVLDLTLGVKHPCTEESMVREKGQERLSTAHAAVYIIIEAPSLIDGFAPCLLCMLNISSPYFGYLGAIDEAIVNDLSPPLKSSLRERLQ